MSDTAADVQALTMALEAGPTPGEWACLDARTLCHIEVDGTGQGICSLPKAFLATATFIAVANPDRIARILSSHAALLAETIRMSDALNEIANSDSSPPWCREIARDAAQSTKKDGT